MSQRNRFPSVVWLALSATALAIAACGGSAGATPTSGAAAGPGSATVPSPTEAAPAQAALSGSSQASSSGYGLVPLPTNTIDWQKDQVYQIGQAIKDPTSGLIFEVTGVRTDSSVAGLDAGQQWLLADVTIGNTGTDTMTISSAGNFAFRDANGAPAGYDLHLLSAISAKLLTPENQPDVDIQPGTAFHGLYPSMGPVGVTGLRLLFMPVQITSNSPFIVSVGP
jgi:hypothetical protein